jgi:Zinc-binding dehydrogenase
MARSARGAFTGVGGGYAEEAIAPAAKLLPLPATMSAVDAVTLGSSGVVAHFGLRHTHFTLGESALVRGAAGGIGIMTVQLAARGGAGAVAVTTSSAERGARLRKLGATHVLDRAGEADEDAPTGYDVIIDIVAGADLPSLFAKLNPNGRMVAVGVVVGDPPADFGHGDVRGVFRSRCRSLPSAPTPCPHLTDRPSPPSSSLPQVAGNWTRLCTRCCPWSMLCWLTRKWKLAKYSAESRSCHRGARARCCQAGDSSLGHRSMASSVSTRHQRPHMPPRGWW